MAEEEAGVDGASGPAPVARGAAVTLPDPGSARPVPDRPVPDRPGSHASVHLRRRGGSRPAAPPSRPASSAGTARRFAERARRHRRAVLRPALVALVVLLLLGAAAWVLLASPLLVVRDVGVLGLDRLDRSAVETVVGPEVGTPLARVDAPGLEEQLEALPLVDSAVVARVWPSDLEVRVVERVPVAALPVPGGYDVVDRSATTVMSTSEPPPDVPVVQVDLATAGEGTVEAVTRVLDELPPSLREQVATAGGTSRDGVVLELRDGARVVWGGSGSTPLKAEVLTSLLPQEAEVYDLSAPGWPVTRDG